MPLPVATSSRNVYELEAPAPHVLFVTMVQSLVLPPQAGLSVKSPSENVSITWLINIAD